MNYHRNLEKEGLKWCNKCGQFEKPDKCRFRFSRDTKLMGTQETFYN